jgi:hypothetical protein
MSRNEDRNEADIQTTVRATLRKQQKNLSAIKQTTNSIAKKKANNEIVVKIAGKRG